MKKLIEEFKKFALRGNVIDLAVGVIIGGAFTGIVNGVSNDFIKPLLAWIMGSKPEEILIGEAQWTWGLAASDFVSTIGKKPEAPKAPTTKKCPYCLSEIPIEATKCAHCTSDLK